MSLKSVQSPLSHLERQLKESFKQSPKSESKMIQLACVSILIANLTSPVFLAGFGVGLKLDPIGIFSSSAALNHVGLLVFRYLLTLLVATIGTYVITSGFVILLVIIWSYNDVIKLMLECALYVNESSKLDYFHRVQRGFLLIKTYKELRVIQSWGDISISQIYPSILLFGQILLVTCNYACIKLHSEFPAILFPVFPVLSGLSCVIIQALLPLTCNVHSDSSKFLVKIKSIVGRDKLLRRVTIAFKPLIVKLGDISYCKRSTKTHYYASCADLTINVLLLI